MKILSPNSSPSKNEYIEVKLSSTPSVKGVNIVQPPQADADKSVLFGYSIDKMMSSQHLLDKVIDALTLITIILPQRKLQSLSFKMSRRVRQTKGPQKL